MALTTRQRNILIRRISRAVLWSEAEKWKRDNAETIARAVVDELEVSEVQAATQRRAIQQVIRNLEAIG